MDIICQTCEIPKTADDFRVYRIKDGVPVHSKSCIPCRKRLQAYQNRSRGKRAYRTGQSQYARLSSEAKRNQVLRRYGLTQLEYDQMLKAQNGLCYMCKRPNQTKHAFHVDHNHSTGEVRRLLCHRCNNGLRFVEDENFLQSAIKYLAEFQKEKVLN